MTKLTIAMGALVCFVSHSTTFTIAISIATSSTTTTTTIITVCNKC